MGEHYIRVQLRGSKADPVTSPTMEKDEAERQLAEIRDVLGGAKKPNVSWLAIRSDDVLDASIEGSSSRPLS